MSKVTRCNRQYLKLLLICILRFDTSKQHPKSLLKGTISHAIMMILSQDVDSSSHMPEVLTKTYEYLYPSMTFPTFGFPFHLRA